MVEPPQTNNQTKNNTKAVQGLMVKSCPYCGSPYLQINLRPDTVHYAEVRCLACGKFVMWLRNPNKTGRTETSRYDLQDVARFHGFAVPFCFLCLRQAEDLGSKETLTIDHIVPLAKGGEDKLENLQILCSACHKLKNWVCTYMNWHLKPEKTEEASS